MLGAFRQLLKICPGDTDQMGVVAALKIKVWLPGQAVVHHDVQAVCSAKRGDRTRFAIDKQRLDLLLIGDVDIGAKHVSEVLKLDVARSWKQCEFETVCAFDNDSLNDAIGRQPARCGACQSGLRMRVGHKVVFNTVVEEILRKSDCNAHGIQS
jgi:hypothetical protein